MFPHQNESAWEVLAPAKLNLYLEVLGPRADGFHELETLLVPVRLYDQLRWTPPAESDPAVAFRLRCQGERAAKSSSDQLIGDENLVTRAVHLLAQRAGIEPRGCFELYQRIPLQAGMGGGSSDAAAALLLANAAWQLGYSRSRLAALAAELGSDVPFFLGRGAAICRGRGELVTPLPAIPPLHFVVVKPPVGISTATLFSKLQATHNSFVDPQDSHARLETLVGALQRGALADAGREMMNRLEQVAAKTTDWIDRLSRQLASIGGLAQVMTGSGSASFCMMRTARQARQAARILAGMNLGKVFAISTC